MDSLFKAETEAAFTPAFREKSRVLAQTLNGFLAECGMVPPATMTEVSHLSGIKFKPEDIPDALQIYNNPDIAAALVHEGANLSVFDNSIALYFETKSCVEEFDDFELMRLHEIFEAFSNSPPNAMIDLQLMPNAAGRNLYGSAVQKLASVMDAHPGINAISQQLAGTPKESTDLEPLYETDFGAQDQFGNVYARYFVQAYLLACSTTDTTALLAELRSLAQPQLDALEISDPEARCAAENSLIATALIPFAEHSRSAPITDDVFYGAVLNENWSESAKVLASGPLSILKFERVGRDGFLDRAIGMIKELGLSLSMDEMLVRRGVQNDFIYHWASESEPPYKYIENLIAQQNDYKTAGRAFSFFRDKINLITGLSEDCLARILVPLASMQKSDDELDHLDFDLSLSIKRLYKHSPTIKSRIVNELAASNLFSPRTLDVFLLTSRDVRAHIRGMDNASKRHIVEHDFSI